MKIKFVILERIFKLFGIDPASPEATPDKLGLNWVCFGILLALIGFELALIGFNWL
jgi:hypothetical protein